MPEKITPLSSSFLDNFEYFTFKKIAFEVSKTLLQNSIDNDLLKQITDEAINFPAPVKQLGDNIFSLELFHGPSLAFKDFGACQVLK